MSATFGYTVFQSDCHHNPSYPHIQYRPVSTMLNIFRLLHLLYQNDARALRNSFLAFLSIPFCNRGAENLIQMRTVRSQLQSLFPMERGRYSGHERRQPHPLVLRRKPGTSEQLHRKMHRISEASQDFIVETIHLCSFLHELHIPITLKRYLLLWLHASFTAFSSCNISD